MKLNDPELQSRLASEYVLGTMKGGARRRFQHYIQRDPQLQDAVLRWENHFVPLTAQLAPVEPHSRVWAAIESRLGHAVAQSKVRETNGLWNSLAFWRNLGLGASVLAGALLIVNVLFAPAEPAPMLTAVLAEDSNVARVLIDQPRSNLLRVKMIKPWKTGTGKSHELWVIPKDGAPRSLGVINDATDTDIPMAGHESKLADGALFAVSIEPPGGSPTGAPTGAIACKGSIAWMPQKTPSSRQQI